MAWNFYLQGLPLDLNDRLTAARTKAELALLDAKRQTRFDHDFYDFQVLIDVRIRPEVIEYASCLCEVVRRRLLLISEVERFVDEYLRDVARTIMGRFFAGLSVQEAIDRVKRSDEWRAHLRERRSVAEQLAAADSASREVERSEETPAPLAASAGDEGQTEQSIAPPLLTPEPAASLVIRSNHRAKDGRRKAVGFGCTLQAFMDECRWSFADLEQETGIDRKRISDHLYYQRFPQSKTLLKYAQAFSKKLARTVTVKELRQSQQK